jgi:hypothetical protein
MRTVAEKAMLGRSALLCIVAIVGACSWSSSTGDRAKCQQLRDHLVDLRLAGANAATERPPALPAPAEQLPAGIATSTPTQRPLTDAEIAAHRHVLSQALGDDFISSCAKTLSPKQLACAQAAADSTAAAACTN